jgi:asparagine synthase (glutamine-hydrolysing)
MCGIAGLIDLSGGDGVPAGVSRRMAEALTHRGPDEDGFLDRPGLALASRRLSIVGLADGRQPIGNEDGTVWAVFNGELFDYPERRAELEAKGHRFRTHTDTELLPHLWEEQGEAMLAGLRGQFALALWDGRARQLLLARDRFGICPLFWAVRRDPLGTELLLFASEVKALLASGLVEARPDRAGIDYVFHFLAQPGPATCFEGVKALLPGRYLSVRTPPGGSDSRINDTAYWEIDFPDRGQEDAGGDVRRLTDGLEEVLWQATQRRLRADVPVVSYLSSGVDSSLVATMATKAAGGPIPTFTIRIPERRLDEAALAQGFARRLGSESHVVTCGDEEVLGHYQRLLVAGEAPVVDTSCVALLLLARSVHDHGYKVALTGEGADEWLAGYEWFKVHRLFAALDALPGRGPGRLARDAWAWWVGAPGGAADTFRRAAAACGGSAACHELYGLMALSRQRFYSADMLRGLADHDPYAGLCPPLGRLRRWHPLNRSIYWQARIHLPGSLLSLKGDRVALHSSVETRYPFLDEDVFAFLARVPPRFKLRGLRDKYLVRKLAERWLPREVAWRPKGMFRAPLDRFFRPGAPAYVGQLLGEESLRRTGYFDVQAVRQGREALAGLRPGSYRRTGVELGLVGVLATQLWHHTFVDPTLADLPGWQGVASRPWSGPAG